MNSLHVGINATVPVPSGGFLYIADETFPVNRARVFDPREHSFNPLENLDYKKSREIADIFYTISPQGENTLTVRNGKRALTKMLMDKPVVLSDLPHDFSKQETGPLEAVATVDDILLSPVLSRVLCNRTNFSFKPNSRIIARINRAELGDFDALVLGLLLMSNYQGQIIVPDLGFYAREFHVRYVRENRLIGSVTTLSQLPQKLREAMLLTKTVPTTTTFDDAETLATYAGHARGTTGYNDFVKGAME